MTFETLKKANELKRKIEFPEKHLEELHKNKNYHTYIGEVELIPIHLPANFTAEYEHSVQIELEKIRNYLEIL